MPRYGSPWLMLLVLGGLASPGAGLAQNSPGSALTLELLQRVEQLESEVRQIRGELEIYRYQVELLQQERATAGPPPAYPPGAATPPTPAERPPSTPPAPAPSTAASAPAERPPSAQPASPTVAGTEQADFDAALGEWREGRYRQAVTGFQRFLNAHPDSGLAGDAQYWLGESYYVGRDYNAAKEAFINLGLRYPQSARLPDALLKLGYIYGEQGDAVRAREVLQKLMQVYPNTQAASLAGRRLQSLR